MSIAASALEDLSLREAVRAPLPGGGEDPRHGDEFLLAKREIDKLKDNDYALVHRLCRTILVNQAKDLRAAGYLLMAALGRDGLAGLLDAAEAYLLLLESCWDEIHPRKDSARLGALDLLNGPRLEALARAAANAAAPEELARLRRCVDAINSRLRARLGDEAPQWRSLDAWLRVKPSGHRAVASPREGTAGALGENAAPEAQAAPQGLPHIGSERQALELTRALALYFREQGHWPQSLAMTRALRWGGVALPPHEQGRTRVPAPRASAVAALDQQRLALDPPRLLDMCEALLLEPGGQFWLDLQYLARQAAKAWGRGDLEQCIDGQTALLLQRLPELATLSFEDGRPFADATTRAWLAELQGAKPSPRETVPRDDWDARLAETLNAARDLAARKKLGEALGLLDQFAADNEGRRLRLALARAALCRQGGRADVALPLVDALEEQAESCRLVLWDQPLALDIWRLAVEVLRDCARKVSAEEKAALDSRARRLHACICRADPAAALQWL
ncbi:type VI secretion system protein TssA [Geoalkalibacter sp.]|uniref:type VI secretion system protein TssA n=1 Tax=Geoalkalibacter sp. TaxID=3041440 RepID=UPI00272DDBA3|nr:type VI secretion system protein TssA [Geoalkalibacter sp.]